MTAVSGRGAIKSSCRTRRLWPSPPAHYGRVTALGKVIRPACPYRAIDKLRSCPESLWRQGKWQSLRLVQAASMRSTKWLAAHGALLQRHSRCRSATTNQHRRCFIQSCARGTHPQSGGSHDIYFADSIACARRLPVHWFAGAMGFANHFHRTTSLRPLAVPQPEMNTLAPVGARSNSHSIFPRR